jgi:hypothetical protein
VQEGKLAIVDISRAQRRKPLRLKLQTMDVKWRKEREVAMDLGTETAPRGKRVLASTVRGLPTSNRLPPDRIKSGICSTLSGGRGSVSHLKSSHANIFQLSTLQYSLNHIFQCKNLLDHTGPQSRSFENVHSHWKPPLKGPWD